MKTKLLINVNGGGGGKFSLTHGKSSLQKGGEL